MNEQYRPDITSLRDIEYSEGLQALSTSQRLNLISLVGEQELVRLKHQVQIEQKSFLTPRTVGQLLIPTDSQLLHHQAIRGFDLLGEDVVVSTLDEFGLVYAKRNENFLMKEGRIRLRRIQEEFVIDSFKNEGEISYQRIEDVIKHGGIRNATIRAIGIQKEVVESGELHDTFVYPIGTLSGSDYALVQQELKEYVNRAKEERDIRQSVNEWLDRAREGNKKDIFKLIKRVSNISSAYTAHTKNGYGFGNIFVGNSYDGNTYTLEHTMSPGLDIASFHSKDDKTGFIIYKSVCESMSGMPEGYKISGDVPEDFVDLVLSLTPDIAKMIELENRYRSNSRPRNEPEKGNINPSRMPNVLPYDRSGTPFLARMIENFYNSHRK